MNLNAAVIGWGKSGQGAAGALLARHWRVSAFASRATDALSFDDVADVPVHVEEDAGVLVSAVVVSLRITRFSPRVRMLASTCGVKWSSRGVFRRRGPMPDAPG